MNYSNNIQLPEPPAHIYLVGIKGQAMTALAQLLKHHGYKVSGSDVAEVFPTDKVLRHLGVFVHEGFSVDNVPADAALVVYSTAYKPEHPELVVAAERGIPLLSHPLLQRELLSLATNRVCVAGTHGKTTTSAMLARILEEAGLNPTALIGAPVAGWEANARAGGDEIFVLEADEYQNKLQYYDATHAVITSVDYDHPDVFRNLESYQQVFVDFIKKIPSEGYVLLCRDNEAFALRSESVAQVETYGLHEASDWKIKNITYIETEMRFEVEHIGQSLGSFQLSYPGEHYALDATAALAMAIRLGAEVDACRTALRHYRGTSRRLERIGNYNDAPVFDDYAHHPSEISPTLRALRDAYPGRRLVVVFEAHTFTRTEALLSQFATALAEADVLYIPPIFGSAREQRGTINEQTFAEAINIAGGHATPVANFEIALALLRDTITENDVVVTMGAGDVWKIAKSLTNV